MKNLALTRIQNMKPYTPPLDGRRTFDGLLLDFNERTGSLAPAITSALIDFLKRGTQQMYPEYGNLPEMIAAYAGVTQDQILITNGSDQGVDLIFRTFTDERDIVIIPTPSFSMFFKSAQSIGNTIISPLYREKNLAFPLSDVIRNINSRVKLIVICNPNNPTGTLVPIADIEKIARKATNAIVLVDEAYVEFSQTSAVSLIRRYPNVVITRTFSKAFGLASFRIGYIIARKEYIKELNKIRGPFDVNMLARVAASAALQNVDDMKQYTREIMTRAKPMIENFFKSYGILFYPSSANFILFQPNNVKQVTSILRANGILVRPQNKPGIQNSIRITIGRVDQMTKFIRVYTRFILKKRYAFLDRDGTLIYEPQDTYQVNSVKQLRVLDGVIKGLQLLIQKGYSLVMITNQDGLGTTNYPLSSFNKVQNKFLKICRENGIVFTNVLICPHLQEDACSCRKPKLGLIKKIISSGTMDSAGSFMCGDRKSDLQFAKNLGIRFVPMKTNGNFYAALAKTL